MLNVDKTNNKVDKKPGNVRKRNQTVILRAAEEEFLSKGYQGASIKSIAARADLPRANIHYYYRNKEELYTAILSDIIGLWNSSFDNVSEDDDPRTAISSYIHAKVMFSKSNPTASRIFASEIIHGAPHIRAYLEGENRHWVAHKVQVIQAWVDAGKITPIDPLNLLFFIWGATQHYADFGVQVCAASNKKSLSDDDYEQIANDLINLVLKGCGLATEKH